MRAIKLIVAIITIIEGVCTTLFALLCVALAFGIGSTGIITNVLDVEVNLLGVLLFLSLVFIGVAVLTLVLGIKFCSRNPDKGIAIALLVYHAFGILSFDFASIILSVSLVVLLAIYLVNIGKAKIGSDTQYQRNDLPYYAQSDKVRLKAECPNYAAQIISGDLGMQVRLSAEWVIVDTSPVNAQRIADTLSAHGVKIQAMQRIS